MASLHAVQRWTGALFDAVLPHRCFSCGVETAGPGLCGDCFGALSPITGSVCNRCGLPFELAQPEPSECAACLARPPEFAHARAAFRYDDDSKALILGLKHHDRLDLVPLLARHLARAASGLVDEPAVIVPVPLHRRRLLSRRFNQSALLARHLSRLTQKPVYMNILRRTRHTPSQGRLNRSQRADNVRAAFQVTKPAMIAGRSVLLVDDVLTTGATAEMCARALSKAGAGPVSVVTVARVVMPGSGDI